MTNEQFQTINELLQTCVGLLIGLLIIIFAIFVFFMFNYLDKSCEYKEKIKKQEKQEFKEYISDSIERRLRDVDYRITDYINRCNKDNNNK